MWDLTIAGDHNFYIDTVASRVLVHNCGGKLDNLASHITERDLSAAERELNGEIVALKAGGTPWDHVHEVRDAQNGRMNVISRLYRMLGNSNLNGADRSRIERDLSRASKMLDYTERYVPRQ